MDIVFYLILPIILSIIAYNLLTQPVTKILSMDKRAGYHIYHKILEETGDKSKAEVAAGKFYRKFGCAIAFVALFFLVSGLIN